VRPGHARGPVFESPKQAALDIAGPGFINIRLQPAAKQQIVSAVLAGGGALRLPGAAQRTRAGRVRLGQPDRPAARGPWPPGRAGRRHLQPVRHAGLAGHREFYYNDAGVQIATLANSTQLRAKGFKPGDAGDWPEAAYNGDYIAGHCQRLPGRQDRQADDRAVHRQRRRRRPGQHPPVRRGLPAPRAGSGPAGLQVQFDNYYLESSLYTSGRVEATVNRLVANGKTYEQDGALWLRSTDYGDDKDRVMRKGDGGYTYFVPDVAYHIAKWERGFTKVVNIQGTDHHGTIARVRAGLQAAGVGIPEGYPDYVLHTMVRVVKGGEEVKISKRAGSYVTLRDLIEWTSTDAVRFFLLSAASPTPNTPSTSTWPCRRTTTTRCTTCSTPMRASARCWRPGAGDASELGETDLSPLDSPAAQALMLALAKYPEMLTAAAQDNAPHDVTFYLRDLAASYHSYYDAERILVDDAALSNARGWR
jgi:arginyl-tRNA synthetase